MFPVRCRVVRGLGAMAPIQHGGVKPVVFYGGGAPLDLTSLPGYRGNNPIQPPPHLPTPFQPYTITASTQPPKRPQDEAMHIRRPPPETPKPPDETSIIIPRRVEDQEARHRKPPVPSVPPPTTQTVAPPPEVTRPIAALPAAAHPVQTKDTPTATVIGIGAAGILAALLFQ